MVSIVNGKLSLNQENVNSPAPPVVVISIIPLLEPKHVELITSSNDNTISSGSTSWTSVSYVHPLASTTEIL